MTIIEADTAKLAGLQIDMLQKMRQGQMTMDHLEWFNNLSKQQRDMLSGADLKTLWESAILKIDRSAPFNPAKFIGQGWTIWRGPKDGNGLEGEEEQDARSLILTEVSLSKVLLETHLKNGEMSTTGEERVRRLNAANQIKVDAKIFQTLWENRDKLPERFRQKTNGNTTYIFCDGTTLRSPDGYRCTLCFYWRAGRREWGWDYFWLGVGRDVSDPSACLASQS